MAVAAHRSNTLLAELADKFEVHLNQKADLKARLPKRIRDVFGANTLVTMAPGNAKIEAKTSGYTWKMIFRRGAHQSGFAEHH